VRARAHDVVRTTLVVLGISVVTSLLAHHGLLVGFETAALDTWLRLWPLTDVRETVIVAIDESDYEKHFGARSPLDQAVLADVLTRIVRGKPAVVGVDLETDPSEVGHRIAVDAGADAPPVVWAAGGSVHGGRVELSPRTRAALDGVPWALALVPQDADGIIRSYERSFLLSRGVADSLPWALVKEYCRTRADGRPPGCGARVDHGAPEAGRVLLNFAADRYEFPRMSVDWLVKASEGPGWTTAGPLRDRIVILGGTFRAARDEHVTPVGPRSGVELIAQAAATELHGGGIRAANEVAMFLAEVVGGFLVAFLHRHHRRLPVRGARWLSLAGIPVIALASSLVAFYSFSRWANFVPVLFGVLLHELYEGAPAPHAEGAPHPG
jgi:CHASE2 domain-containing sensor protein